MKGVVASVMHTGTWFTFEVIKRLTGDVVLPWRHMFESQANNCEWLHIHVNEDPWSQVRYIRPMLLEAFVERSCFPTVIPLRDPVLALITRHLRREQDHVPVQASLFEMVEGFSRLAEWYCRGLCNVFWFPVDLMTLDPLSKPPPPTAAIDHEAFQRIRQRVVRLRTLESFLDRHSIRHFGAMCTQQLAEEWPVHNETHAFSTLKQRYLGGDVAAVEAVLPDEMEELRSRDDVAEMFADLGYTLPWVRS